MALDVNGDGHVDFKELCCGISAACRGPTAERIKFCFKIFDMDRDGFLNSKELQHMIDILLFVAKENKIHFNSMNRPMFSTLERNNVKHSHGSISSSICSKENNSGLSEMEKVEEVRAPLASQEQLFHDDGFGYVDENYKKVLESLKRRLNASECLSQEDFLIWGVDDNSLVSPLLQLLFEICHVSLGLKPHCRHHEYEIGKMFKCKLRGHP